MDEGRSYLLEFQRIGNIVKVTACDPVTDIEVVIQGPARATRKELTDLAVRKLEYMIKKNSSA